MMATELHGNTETVLTVTTTADGRIITGGENGELCLWTSTGTLIKRCTCEGGEDVTSIACSHLRPQLMYIASSCRILAVDLRELDKSLYALTFNEEEINQLQLNEKEDYLAACDDSGQIKVINVFDKRLHKTLRKHTNICATVSFHPKRPWDLFSGGYDSKLVQWDFSRGRSVFVMDMEHVGVQGGQTNEYVINPPFVHSLAIDPSGKYLACANESSTVHLFQIQKKNPDYWLTLHAHTQGVSQVHFPRSHPGHLISAGNDCKICVWHLASLTSHLMANGHSEPSQALVQAQSTNTPITTIVHDGKINWLTTVTTDQRTYIIIADNSDKVIMYPYPI